MQNYQNEDLTSFLTEEDYWHQNHPVQNIEDTIKKIHDKSPANYILDLHSYCENCPAFEVVQETNTMFANDIAVNRIHTITCAKKPLCEQLYSFIERKYKNGKN